ncbi:hypothetical protein [Leptospira sp. GIMC2001]|uniref:hypothetical protein n=1 Tax=Leptospira sp. GIMC2001 TaxID=1513297 RepID=UPI00234A87F6|nr:hypothetical protein [Leptospira sp. GIMC2001]WCL48231.1 hypothetical protein O4O04_13050 [Leptospira sp. GIMC2001]
MKKISQKFLTILLLMVMSNCTKMLKDIPNDKFDVPKRYENYKLVINYESIEDNLVSIDYQKDSYNYFKKSGQEEYARSIDSHLDISRKLAYDTIQNSLNIKNKSSSPDGYLSVIVREGKTNINGYPALVLLVAIVPPILLGIPLIKYDAYFEVEVAEFNKKKELVKTYSSKSNDTEYMEVLYYGYDYPYQASSLIAIKKALRNIREQMEKENDFE